MLSLAPSRQVQLKEHPLLYLSFVAAVEFYCTQQHLCVWIPYLLYIKSAFSLQLSREGTYTPLAITLASAQSYHRVL